MINPNFTPVDLIRQTTAVWQGEIASAEEGLLLNVKTTDVLKGEALAAQYVLSFEETPFMEEDIRSALPGGKGTAFFLSGDFSGASMDGGEIDETPKAMMKLGARWYMITASENGTLMIREDPIDLSTVWAGDVRNLRQVTEYVLKDPRATVPVASGARWASETKVADLEVPVSRMETVVLAENPLLFLYSTGGDRIFAMREGELLPQDGYLGITSASAHAAWGRFVPAPVPSMMSLSEEGVLTLWSRVDEEFVSETLPLNLPEATGLATIALPERAGLLAGTAAGMREVVFEDGEWKLHTHTAPEAAGAGGPVYAVDLNGDGLVERFQAHENGLVLLSGAEKFFHPYTSIGTPLSLAVADFDGDGRLDLLIGGERGASLLIQTSDNTFEQRLATTGELAYNVRAGVHHIGIGDHAQDGRIDLVLFNQQLPPQIYFNRGFAVFGYDMELDLQEDAPDTLDAAGEGQQAGLLADLDGNGLQELALLTLTGELWLLRRDAEAAAPLGAGLKLPGVFTGPAPLLIRDGERIVGARVAAPHAPAWVGRRNRGPIDVAWRVPGRDADVTQRVIVLRPAGHELRGE